MSKEHSAAESSGTAWYRRPDFYFWLIAAAGLLFRLEYLREFSIFEHFDCAIGPDVQDYHERAQGILNGEFLPSTPHIHAPLYSFFLALLYKVTGNSIPWVRFIQLVLNWGVWIGFAKLLKHRQAPDKTVLAFLAFAMFVPALIFHQAELISESLLSLILLGAFFLLCRGEDEEKNNPYNFAGAGFFAGLAILTHGFLWAFAATETAYCFWRRQWKRGILFLCGVLCAVIPVILAKSIYYEKWTPIQNNSMFNIWLGHNPKADGGCWMRSDRAWQEEHRNTAAESRARGIPVSYIYLERIGRFYRDNPRAIVKLTGKKLWKLILPVEFISGSDSPAMIGKTPVQRYFRFTAVVLGLFAVSGIALLMLKQINSPSRYIHFYLLTAALAAAQLLSVTAGRYRMGMMPGVLLLAATAVSALKSRQIIVAAAWIAVLAMMLPPLPEIDPVERSIMGEAYFRKGKYAEADSALNLASTVLDDPTRFGNLRGIIAEKRGNLKKAEAFYASALSPYNSEANFNLGFMLSKHFREPERLTSANMLLLGGLKISPQRADAWNQIGVNLFTLNQLQFAKKAFEAALKIAPEHPGYRRNLEIVNSRIHSGMVKKTAHPAINQQ